MAATLPPLAEHAREWQHANHHQQQQQQRTRSQPPPERRHDHRQQPSTPRAKRRSSNYVKSKPAKPIVIDSILESLDSLTPPTASAVDKAPTETSSQRSLRPRSMDGARTSSPALSRSSGFGMEYGTGGLSVVEDDEGSDAAEPPTIRTSRRPSGMSQYTALRAPSFTGGSQSRARSVSSVQSARSSFSGVGKEKDWAGKNKLSAESWVKQNAGSTDSLGTTKSRKSRLSLRRISSRDTLRNSRTRMKTAQPSDDAAEPRSVSRTEGITTKSSTPSPGKAKGRLFIAESDSNDEEPLAEEPIFESPVFGRKMAQRQQSLEALSPTLSQASDQRSSRQPSPAKQIADSIPTRISSLRQSENLATNSKKKEKKEKKEKRQKSSKKAGKQPEQPMNESSWQDLGEDDGTVRRIRELQEKRKSRMLEANNPFSTDLHSPTSPKSPRSPGDWSLTPDVPSTSPHRSEVGKRTPAARKSLNRAATEPPVKAHKILGIADANGSPATVQSSKKSRAEGRSPDEAYTGHVLPEPARGGRSGAISKLSSSPTPSLSLDYSYIQAVDALQRSENQNPQEKREKREKRDHRDAVAGASSPLRELDSPRIESPSSGRGGSKSLRRKQDRWTAHPDIPIDNDKRRSRRKSMSDAKNSRASDSEPTLGTERDSMDIAVDEYLDDDRLSRTIKHPLTGRVISYSEVGDPNGAAVIVCVGMGLTRFVTAFYDELATELHLRLITVDRPGVGNSEPYPPSDRSGPLGWPDDVLTICQDLGITKFSILAHSAGAIYALATTLILPQHIVGKVHLLAPWIPPSQLEAISHPAASAPPAGALPRSQRFLRVLPTPLLKAANSSFMTATSASLKPAPKRKTSTPSPANTNPRRPSNPGRCPGPTPLSSTDPPIPEHPRRESLMLMDQHMPSLPPGSASPPTPPQFTTSATAYPTDETFSYASAALSAAHHADALRQQLFASRLTQRTWERATRDSNPATDLLVCLERNREIGFRYVDAMRGRGVVITHGGEDRRVPVGNVRWLGEEMNRRALAGGGWWDEAGEGGGIGTTNGNGRVGGVEGGCEVRVLENEGHGLMASPGIMGDVLTEIKGYWRGVSF